MDHLRVIIAGGGTGGHIFPAVAVGHALQRLVPGTQLLFVGAKGKMEMEKVPQEGFEIIGLDIVGFNRRSLWKNLSLPFKLLKSRQRAQDIIREFNPSAVVGVGGYASFPVMHAAQDLGVPTLIQEQNSYAGRTNKLLARKAKAICVAYDNMAQFFPASKLLHTGNPVRKAITDMAHTGQEGRAWFGLQPGFKTILIVGGSQGARSVNESIEAMLPELMKENVQLIWQTGIPYYQQALSSAAQYGSRINVCEFIKEMDYAYAAADMVVSRAGALAIAELCIAGKPVIFVPLPSAAEDHQTSNAMALVTRSAALLVKDNETRTELIKKIKAVLHDAKLQEVMSHNLLQLAVKDADERIARKVMEIAGYLN